MHKHLSDKTSDYDMDLQGSFTLCDLNNLLLQRLPTTDQDAFFVCLCMLTLPACIQSQSMALQSQLCDERTLN